jgi:hypothetical protein
MAGKISAVWLGIGGIMLAGRILGIGVILVSGLLAQGNSNQQPKEPPGQDVRQKLANMSPAEREKLYNKFVSQVFPALQKELKKVEEEKQKKPQWQLLPIPGHKVQYNTNAGTVERTGSTTEGSGKK